MDEQGLKFLVVAPLGEGKTKLLKRLIAALERLDPALPVAGFLSENILVAESASDESGVTNTLTSQRTSISVTDLGTKKKQVLASRAPVSPFALSFRQDDYHVNTEAVTGLVVPSIEPREGVEVYLLDDLTTLIGQADFDQALGALLDSPCQVIATLSARHEKLEALRQHPSALVIALTRENLPALVDLLVAALAARQPFAQLAPRLRENARRLVRWYLGSGRVRSATALFREIIPHAAARRAQLRRPDGAAWEFEGNPGARVVEDLAGELTCSCPLARGLSPLAGERQECPHVQAIRFLGDEVGGRWAGLIAGAEGEGVLGSPGSRGALGVRTFAGQPREDGATLVVEEDFLVAAVAEGRWGEEASRRALDRARGLLGGRPPSGQELRGRLFALFHAINEELYELALSAPGAPTPEVGLLVVALDRRHHRLHYARFGEGGLFIGGQPGQEPLALLPPESSSRLGFLSALASRSRGGDLVLDDLEKQARDTYVGVAAGLQEGVLSVLPGSSVLLATSGLGAVLGWSEGIAPLVTDRLHAPGVRLASLLELAHRRQLERRNPGSLAAVLLES